MGTFGVKAGRCHDGDEYKCDGLRSMVGERRLLARFSRIITLSLDSAT